MTTPLSTVQLLMDTTKSLEQPAYMLTVGVVPIRPAFSVEEPLLRVTWSMAMAVPA